MILRVMTYNIQSGIGIDGAYDWKRSCTLIAAHKPDIVGLEEVSVNRFGSPPVNYWKEAASYLEMNPEFGKAMDLPDNAEYGVAALSKYPFDPVEKIFLPVPDGEEPRPALIMKVQAEKPFYFIVTHFSFQGEFENDDTYRLESARRIQRTIEEKGYYPAILVGDLNAAPTAPALEFLRQSWDVMNDNGADTPTAETQKYGWMQIDFICTYPKKAFRCNSFEIIDDRIASDHRPVLAELKLL